MLEECIRIYAFVLFSGNAIGVFFAICVNLSNTFAIMYISPETFTDFTYFPCCSGRCKATKKNKKDIAVHMTNSCWFKLARFLSRWPNNLIVVICLYAALIPLAICSLQFKTGHSWSLVVGKITVFVSFFLSTCGHNKVDFPFTGRIGGF